MATGIIASLGSSVSATYTPQTDTKVTINAAFVGGGGTVNVNGQPAFAGSPSTFAGGVVYVGAGQTLTVTTSTSATCAISALES